MTNQTIVDDLVFVSKWTEIFGGNPFHINLESGKFRIGLRKERYYVVGRIVLNFWNTCAIIHHTFWLIYSKYHRDQSETEDLLDALMVGGMAMSLLVQVFIYTADDTMIEFINAVLKLNGELQKKFTATTSHSCKGRTWNLPVMLQFLSALHSVMLSYIFFQKPDHRRYLYKPLLGHWVNDCYIRCFTTTFQFSFIMSCWGSLLFFTQIISCSNQITSFWLRESRFGQGSNVTRKSIRFMANTFWIMRSLQVVNSSFNHLFQNIIPIYIFLIWANLVYYTVTSVRFILPSPECFTMPVISIGGTLYVTVALSEMYEILDMSKLYLHSWKQSSRKLVQKYFRSFRVLKVELARKSHITRNTPTVFVAKMLEYTIDVLIATQRRNKFL